MDLDFQTIFKEMNKLGIDYLVIGGLAVFLGAAICGHAFAVDTATTLGQRIASGE